MQNYEHRQFSPWPLLALGLFAALGAAKAFKLRAARMPSLGLALFVAQFSALTTGVDDAAVSWSFGVGFPGGTIPLEAIAAVERTKTKLWEGLGIHWTPPHGWLWNVAGGDAVTIRKRSGGKITLGSDDAAGLYQALSERLAHTLPHAR